MAFSEDGLHPFEEVVDPYPLVGCLYEFEADHEFEDFVKSLLRYSDVSGYESPLEFRVLESKVVRVCQNFEEYAICRVPVGPKV